MKSSIRIALCLGLAGGAASVAGAGAAGAVSTPLVTVLDAPPSALAAADVDGDGRRDLVISQFGGETKVLVGDGRGGFASGARIPGSSWSIALYRFDGDTAPDLVRSDGTGIAFAPGGPGGVFGALRGLGPSGAGGIVIGDFNGDGHRDVAGSPTVALGDGDGHFTSVPTPGIARSDVRQLTVGDFNRDLRQDLAYVNAIGSGVMVQLGRGDGTFGPVATYPASQPFALAAADLDGDLDQDLVAANAGSRNSVSVLLSDGRGGFVAQPDVPIGGRGIPSQAAIADLNGDGALDVATSVTNAGFGALSVRYGDGHGAFPGEQVIDLPAEMPGRLTTADFTGDGRCDIALAMIDPGAIHVFPGEGAPGPAGTEPCRDRVGDPVGGMAQRVLTPSVTARAGAPVTAHIELSRPAVVAASFSRSPRAKPGRRRVVAAGRRTITLTAPATAGRYTMIVSAGSLEGTVVRRGLRVTVTARPRHDRSR